MKHTKSYHKNHPRPHLYRHSYQLLNGQWLFAYDDQDEGIRKRWYNEIPSNTNILVPHTYETQSSEIYDQKRHDVIWYQKDIEIKTQKEVLLHLEGSDYETSVWVNGIFIEKVYGGYQRHTVNITQALKSHNNQRIVIRVKDDFDTAKPRGKQRWKDESFGCWYIQTTGIWKSVWLEFVDSMHIKDVIISTDQSAMIATCDINYAYIKPNTSLRARLWFDDVLIAQSEQMITHQHQKIHLSFRTDQDQFKIKNWSIEQPNLYDVQFEVIENNLVIDDVYSYFGVRTIETKKQGIYINGNPIYLKMILHQGYYPLSGLSIQDEEQLAKDIKTIQSMGFNGIRMHQKIEDERFYYYCDIMGIYVWLEMPSAYEFNDTMMTRFQKEWLDVVHQYRHYVSIITYVIFNESWGLPNIRDDHQQQQFSVALYHLTKALDPTRLVISNDGWEHTKSDIITIHNYVETGLGFKEIYSELNGMLNHEYQKFNNVKRIFSDGFDYHQEPIMISEYGGIAFSHDQGWGYGNTVATEAAYIQRLEGLTDAIKETKSVSGYCLTQFTDVEHETNGILTIDRKEKVNMKEIKRINEK